MWRRLSFRCSTSSDVEPLLRFSEKIRIASRRLRIAKTIKTGRCVFFGGGRLLCVIMRAQLIVGLFNYEEST